MPTAIEWTEETWNPATGCSMVSPGCRHCYAARMARRLDGQGVGYDGTTKASEAGSRMAGAYWTGRVNWLPERLEVPLRWRKPRSVFVCSMADLFHEHLTNERIAAVFGVMAATPHHTYQVLTKRAERMLSFFDWLNAETRRAGLGDVRRLIARYAKEELIGLPLSAGGYRRRLELLERIVPATEWPLPNVWLGVSTEDQRRLEERIIYLVETPAAIRFLSCEPLLEALDFNTEALEPPPTWDRGGILGELEWIIAGGESGAGARPPHPAWFRKLRDDATEAGVAFFFKQWGAWAPYIESLHSLSHRREVLEAEVHGEDGDAVMVCIGKKRAGRRLDGRTWDETPTTEDSDGKT